MFMFHPDGKSDIIYKRKLYGNAVIYKRGDPRFDGVQLMQGYIQHYYNCPVRKKEQQEWARKYK
jgi:hypothetical protein